MTSPRQMTSRHDITFAPRTIAQARTARAQHTWRVLSSAARKLARRLRAISDRMALSRQYQRELAFLVRGDDRMLADMGLTRYDVVAAARENDRWFGRGQALHMAAIRREEAAALARTRCRTLPFVEAPPLAADALPVPASRVRASAPRR